VGSVAGDSQQIVMERDACDHRVSLADCLPGTLEAAGDHARDDCGLLVKRKNIMLPEQDFEVIDAMGVPRLLKTAHEFDDGYR
jgi:hypothetical protein